jgi:carbon-monoxide dehydrogenase medium subunit
MWEQYAQPNRLEEALTLLAQDPGRTRLVAGGTDLVLEIERGMCLPRTLIDLSRIAELGRIRMVDGIIHLGPLVTHNQIVGSGLLVERAYPLARACWEVGAPQIRNRGTVGGNLVTASPANDTITPLWALDASVTLRSLRGDRVLSLAQFFQGVRRTALAPDEVLVDIAFPALAGGERGTFIKLGLRQSQAVSVVNIAVVLGFEGDLIRTARIAFGSVAPTIVRAPGAERFLVGKALTRRTILAASRLAAAAARPIDDIRAPAGYRSGLMGTLTARALTQLAGHSERDDWPARPAMLGGGPARPAPRRPGPGTLHTREGDEPIQTTINGRPFTFRGANGWTLLRLVREAAGLTGAKEGCGEGECGACTVYLDGAAVMGCLVPAARAHGATVGTIEGLAREDRLHPVQQAFIDADAIQCGYCSPGFIMAGAKLLEEHPRPTRQQIEQGISGNLCRCTGYMNIVRAIEQAACVPVPKGLNP